MVNGAKIRQLRKDKGLRLVDLSKLSDVSISRLSEIETGLAVPTLKTLEKIADALRVDVKKLL